MLLTQRDVSVFVVFGWDVRERQKHRLAPFCWGPFFVRDRFLLGRGRQTKRAQCIPTKCAYGCEIFNACVTTWFWGAFRSPLAKVLCRRVVTNWFGEPSEVLSQRSSLQEWFQRASAFVFFFFFFLRVSLCVMVCSVVVVVLLCCLVRELRRNSRKSIPPSVVQNVGSELSLCGWRDETKN